MLTRRHVDFSDSGFDLVSTFTKDDKGNKLTPRQRENLADLMGGYRNKYGQTIEEELTELFKDPGIRKEMEDYRRARQNNILVKHLTTL